MVTSISKAGKPFQDRTDGIKYNAQVASASEFVSGRFASKGATDAIAELATFGKEVIGVFGKQKGFGGFSSTGPIVYDDNYAVDGGDVNIQSFGPYVFTACLNDGETSIKGRKVGFETLTGKATMYDASTPWVGIFMQSVAASGSDEDVEVLFLGNGHLSYVEETLTVTADVSAACSYLGATMPVYVEDTGNDVVYSVSSSATATDNAICTWSNANKTLTFAAADDPATVTVGYFV